MKYALESEVLQCPALQELDLNFVPPRLIGNADAR